MDLDSVKRTMTIFARQSGAIDADINLVNLFMRFSDVPTCSAGGQ